MAVEKKCPPSTTSQNTDSWSYSPLDYVAPENPFKKSSFPDIRIRKSSTKIAKMPMAVKKVSALLCNARCLQLHACIAAERFPVLK